MAKKEKIQLTPEEIEAKKIRRSNGWTRFWAIVVALALTAGVFAFARTQGIKASEGTEVTTSESGENNNSGNNNPSSSANSNSSSSSSSSSDSSSSSSSSSSSNNSAAPADNSGNSAAPAGANDAASVADLINKATAAAVNAKAGYDWERHCTVENIDVGSATNILNKIIQGVDSNADLNSVVGGFLGRGDKQATVPKGMTLDTIDVPKDDGGTEKVYHGASYTLKASNLQAADIQNLSVNGDTYEFDLADSNNPDRSGNTAFSRFCNDIVVVDEVNKEIQEQVGSAVTVNSLDAKYHNIHVKAVITDGQLKELSYSMKGDAALGLKAAVVPINGTGNLDANAKYSNFVY
ncbi:MAG: hypothetical protein IJK26_02450 [Clostridia bacterium]|nr:hypothetical protein [Clostridia bacterium]